MNQQDLKQISERGISEDKLNHQLEQFKTGFPFLKLKSAAAVGKGILVPDEKQIEENLKAGDNYKKEGHKIVKFVPASGAASRMFKNMFAFLGADYDVPTSDFEKKFFDEIHNFAFYNELDAKCKSNQGKGIDELIKEGSYKAVVANLL